MKLLCSAMVLLAFAATTEAMEAKVIGDQIIMSGYVDGSELARAGLTGAPELTTQEPESVFGFRPFPKDGRVVSNALINRLRKGGEY